MKKLKVNLGDRSYPIIISNNALSSEKEIKKLISHKQVAVITTKKIASLHLAKIKKYLNLNKENILIYIPDGEHAKSIKYFSKLLNSLIKNEFKRDGLLIALGGGVVGDLVGFTAACYQRGIKFIQCPTTLLSQVDSSVGGKTGINHESSKNMIGAFHQPSAVFCDLSTLETLSKRQLRAGLAEILKYGLIEEKSLWSYCQKNKESILSLNKNNLENIIYESCKIKARIVSQDERESGVRAHLNFGHTFGHAIEAIEKYKNLLHGEAVGLGMHMASLVSMRIGALDKDSYEEIYEGLCKFGFLPKYNKYSANELLQKIRLDKKNNSSRFRFILLSNIGKAFIHEVPSVSKLKKLISLAF